MHTLYICYFGIREPLVQTQVLPYLRQLVRDGVEVSLLTFEPKLRLQGAKQEFQREKVGLAAQGIRWEYLPYHKRPSIPATLYDIAAGAWRVARIARRDEANVVHARAHVPLAMALLARLLIRSQIVFDIRGLMAEEYADAGVWSDKSLAFYAVKRLERAGLKRADRIVVLTRRMRDWLVDEGLARAEVVEVIPCCVDLSLYAAGGEDVEKDGRFEVVYAGSVTGLYMLEEMGRFFLELRAHEPRAVLRILTTSPLAEASAVLSRVGLDPGDFWIGGVSAAEVPQYLRGAQLGLSFRKPTFSQLAASPTKIPEYLASGVPVVSNAGIGDTDELLEGERVGVLIPDFTPEAYARAAAAALRLAREPGVSERCVAAARKHFDLESVGGVRYGNVYRLLGRGADLD